MRRDAIDTLLQQRARHACGQQRLIVDYYRIRWKLGYPLPLTDPGQREYTLRFQGEYPWMIWPTWTLEERIHQLAAAAELFGDGEAKRLLNRDLFAWAQWPKLNQLGRPDLGLSHGLRTMVTATRCWQSLLDTATQQAMTDACTRAVDSFVDWYDPDHPGCARVRSRPDHPPVPTTQNMPIIGTLSLALAARTVQHKAAADLRRHARAMIDHLLAERGRGFSEGVSYDGYVLDVLCDWVIGETPEVQKAVLGHPQIETWVRQSMFLGVPGKPEQIAPLGDIEPREMAFHLTALAKLAHLQPRDDAHWLLQHCDLDWLRSEALVAMRDLPENSPWQPPRGAIDAHYALVLRSGHKREDLAIIAMCPRTRMGHPHADPGTLVIGTAGHWLIDDPGYQQFLDTSEREFTTMGPAHNAPLLNGKMLLDFGKSKVRQLCNIDESTSYAVLDLTACYRDAPQPQLVERHLWLIGREAVIVADRIEMNPLTDMSWSWHGHPDAAWWVEEGQVLLQLGEQRLWMQCPQITLGETMIQRLRGSRGQLTLSALRTATQLKNQPLACTWWVFYLGSERPAAAQCEGDSCHWRGRTSRCSTSHA